MPPTSALLQKQFGQIFGSPKQADVKAVLVAAQALAPETLIDNICRLLETVDTAYGAYAGLQRSQAALSEDTYADWNLISGTIDSGFQWKRVLGYELDALDNQIASWQKLLHSEDQQSLQSQIAEHVSGKKPRFEAFCRMRNQSGDWQWQLVRGQLTARGENGEATRFLVMQRDCSALKSLERETEAAREALSIGETKRKEFIANIGHEIRTPINGILGMTELALDTTLTDEQRQYLRTVKKSAEGLAAIISDMMDFSSLESGQVTLIHHEFSPFGLLADIAKSRAIAARRKGVELLLDIAPTSPSRVAGDPDRLRQIVENLLDNAIKFTTTGEITLSVKPIKAVGAAVWLELSVSDTGIGIPINRQKGIFDGFSQADGSSTRAFGGTGLGLAISSRLVAALGGEISLESEVGKGTTVRFSIRLDCLPDQETSSQSPMLKGKRALILMTNSSASNSLTRQLEHLGITVRSGISATEASIAIVRSRTAGNAFDYLFIDASMPDQGGLALLQDWQQAGRHEQLVLLLEPDFTQDERLHLRSLGAETHLVKPVGPEELLNALAQNPIQAKAVDFELDFDNLNSLTVPTGKSLKILVADDSPVQQDLLCRYLAGHQITLANHGAEAIEHFERTRFDVILMDAQMPVMDGMAAIEAIRARELRRSWVISEEFRPSAIIAMISHASVSESEQCEQAGANFVLVKPLTAEGLHAALEKVLAPDDDSANPGALATPSSSHPPAARVNLHAALDDIGDLDLLGTLASMFVEDWDKYAQRISDAIRQQSHAMLRQYAHELKGVSAMFHLSEVRRVCLELEKGEKAIADWSLAANLENRLFEEMSLVRGVMENFARTRVISY